MPQVKIDKNALEILKDEKQELRDDGINATYSDAIRSLKDGDQE